MKSITGLLVGFLIFFCVGFFSYVMIITDNPVSNLVGDKTSDLIIATLSLLIISVIIGIVGYVVVVRQLEKIELEKDSS